MKPLRPCAEPGCPNKVAKGRCVEHQRQRERERGSSAQRGYGQDHRDRREMVLARDPLCKCCEAMGVVTPATVCDHILPITAGGAPDDIGNMQGLCDGKTGRGCHDRKRAAESRGRQLVIRPGIGFVDVGPLPRKAA